MANKKYPHLLDEDAKLWEEFLVSKWNFYESFQYDVRVGLGRPPGPGMTTNQQQMAIDLSQRRIDAVGYTSAFITIFEITLKADLKALGQSTAYPTLYKETYPDTRPINYITITRAVGTDLLHIFELPSRHYTIVFPRDAGEPIVRVTASGLRIKRLLPEDLAIRDFELL